MEVMSSKIMRQTSAVISKEGYACTATILVQKDAPLDLLLGTDLQSKLAFLFLQRKRDETAVDLLQEREWVLTKADAGPSDNHSASCHVADPDMESSKPSNLVTRLRSTLPL